MKIFAVITIMSTRLPLNVARPTFSIPDIALTNVMACRVFRRLRLGLIDDSHLSMARTGLSNLTLHFQRSSPNQDARSHNAEDSDDEVHSTIPNTGNNQANDPTAAEYEEYQGKEHASAESKV